MAKIKFDPNIPVSTSNPWPDWPIRNGRKVWYVENRFRFPEVNSGFVRWYHPARRIDASCCVTPGRPFYGIVGGELVDAQLVFPCTKDGRAKAFSKALLLLRARIKSVNEWHEQELAAIDEAMTELNRKAGDA